MLNDSFHRATPCALERIPRADLQRARGAGTGRTQEFGKPAVAADAAEATKLVAFRMSA